jgi:hypothetical protein
LLRFDVADRALKIPRLRYLLEQEAERLSGAFVVLEADQGCSVLHNPGIIQDVVQVHTVVE